MYVCREEFGSKHYQHQITLLVRVGLSHFKPATFLKLSFFPDSDRLRKSYYILEWQGRLQWWSLVRFQGDLNWLQLCGKTGQSAAPNVNSQKTVARLITATRKEIYVKLVARLSGSLEKKKTNWKPGCTPASFLCRFSLKSLFGRVYYVNEPSLLVKEINKLPWQVFLGGRPLTTPRATFLHTFLRFFPDKSGMSITKQGNVLMNSLPNFAVYARK